MLTHLESWHLFEAEKNSVLEDVERSPPKSQRWCLHVKSFPRVVPLANGELGFEGVLAKGMPGVLRHPDLDVHSAVRAVIHFLEMCPGLDADALGVVALRLAGGTQAVVDAQGASLRSIAKSPSDLEEFGQDGVGLGLELDPGGEYP